ncbi:MAG TPA: hypothetical protein VGQ03_00525 [Nitrososphaera sp.]|nr:hypothetical protein [Nitrososphaera sp.]
MQKDGSGYRTDVMHCRCGLCDHDSRNDCISGRCYCCDLEDAFAVLTHFEFEPKAKWSRMNARTTCTSGFKLACAFWQEKPVARFCLCLKSVKSKQV